MYIYIYIYIYVYTYLRISVYAYIYIYIITPIYIYIYMLYPTLCVCFGAGSHHGTFICTVAKGGASIAMQPSSIPFAGQSGARNFSL